MLRYAVAGLAFTDVVGPLYIGTPFAACSLLLSVLACVVLMRIHRAVAVEQGEHTYRVVGGGESEPENSRVSCASCRSLA
jgi:hypothetical protein